MRHLIKVQTDVKLRDLILPGSHDAATSTIARHKPFSAVSVTQNVSVGDQLRRGVRFLDLRIAGGTSGSCAVSIYHGMHQGSSLQTVLQGIADFLVEHANEVLVIEFVAEYGRHFTSIQKKTALDMIKQYLGEYVMQEPNNYKLFNRTTLKSLVQSNQRVCLLIHPRIWEAPIELDGVICDAEYVAKTYHYRNSHDYAINKWHNTRDCMQLLDWNLDEVHRHGSDRDRLLVNQFVLTPGVGGLHDVAQLLVGMASLRPVSLVNQLVNPMNDFVRQHGSEPWNIVLMDFVDLVPAFIAFLISLNFGAKLQIVKADIGINDVTIAIQQYIVRGKVLYLTHVAKDLGVDACNLDDEDTLVLEYKFGSWRATHTMELVFDQDSQIVFGEYIHNAANSAAT
jgi:hypothetical protein